MFLIASSLSVPSEPVLYPTTLHMRKHLRRPIDHLKLTTFFFEPSQRASSKWSSQISHGRRQDRKPGNLKILSLVGSSQLIQVGGKECIGIDATDGLDKSARPANANGEKNVGGQWKRCLASCQKKLRSELHIWIGCKGR